MQTARREDLAVYGKAPSDIPALKPYWGKPAVRNFREDGGNVGIIRSPVRATALPGEVLRGQDTRGQRPARPGAGSEGRGPRTRTPWPGIPVGFRSVEPGDHGLAAQWQLHRRRVGRHSRPGAGVLKWASECHGIRPSSQRLAHDLDAQHVDRNQSPAGFDEWGEDTRDPAARGSL